MIPDCYLCQPPGGEKHRNKLFDMVKVNLEISGHMDSQEKSPIPEQIESKLGKFNVEKTTYDSFTDSRLVKTKQPVRLPDGS